MGRTHLTTSPGAPLRDASSARSEVWSAGPALPVEPTWPGRYRRVGVALVAVALVVAIAAGYSYLNARANSFDPSFEIGESLNPSDGLPGEELPDEG